MSPALEHVTGGELPYLLSVPAGGGGRSTSPVLCFLHGYGEAAPTDIHTGITRDGPLRPGSAAIAREEFIVVAPQLPQAGDLWHRHADSVRSIVQTVRREHGGDPHRLYLTGFSFGGNGVFDLGEAQPGTWAALWAVDPTRVPADPLERPVWLSVGEVARRLGDAFVRTLGLSPAEREPLGERVVLDEGGDHVESARLAYRDDRIYRWLLGFRRG